MDLDLEPFDIESSAKGQSGGIRGCQVDWDGSQVSHSHVAVHVKNNC